MCIDLKLTQKANKDKLNAKYELGNFCEQYGLPPVAPSRRKSHKYSKHKHKSSYKYSNKYKKNYSPSKSKDKFYTKPKKQYYKS